MRKIIVAASLWMAALATPGLAADREACGAGLVCASDPQTVVKALQAAGYKALLSKSKQTGNPKIESAASGYDYSIFFYECEQTLHCGSLQFQVSFEDDGGNTPELANKWNKDKRFAQMRSEEHTSELKSLMRISYTVICLKHNQKRQDIIT